MSFDFRKKSRLAWQKVGASVALGLGLAGGLTSCKSTPTPQPEQPGFVQQNPDALRTLKDEGDVASLRRALLQSAAWARRKSPDTRYKLMNGVEYSAADLVVALNAVAAALEKEDSTEKAVELLAGQFDVYAVPAVPSDTEGAPTRAPLLVTGYYVPVAEGVFAATDGYKIPVWGVPPSLVTASLGQFNENLKGKSVRGRVEGHKLVPYWDRNAIREKNVLAKETEPIAWVKDEFDLFVIEVQGSGVIKSPDGQRRVIGYADQNGLGYKAVGKLLLDEQKIPRDKMSMHTIGEYLKANPSELRRVLDYNPSFVFFKVNEREEIVGNLNVSLTPQRSVATDQSVYPPGLPLLLSVDKPALNPNGTIAAAGKMTRIMVNQDTGGAIRGRGRMDFFWGEGDEASKMANMMQHRGDVWVFVPKKRTLPVADAQ